LALLSPLEAILIPPVPVSRVQITSPWTVV
jgi:hypothetical protein